jgi:folate-binding protein YgfZ
MKIETVSFEQQYDALRNGGGLVQLDDWSSVTVSGADRHAFLNNFCTNDIKRLVPGQSCEAFFTNVKGKIVAHGLVSCRENELVIVGVPSQAPSLIEHLDRYVIREDVQFRDTSAERNYLFAAGGSIAGERFGILKANDGFAPVSSHAISWDLINSVFASVIELPPQELPKVRASLYGHGFVVADLAFAAARIEAGVPLFHVDFDERHFPQEVGRDGEAISFTKGCYLGQETVARIDALGHVNQRLVGLRFLDGLAPDAGMELTQAGHKVGDVTSAALSPRLNAPLALAMVRREANSTGTRLESPVGTCEVVALPVGS